MNRPENDSKVTSFRQGFHITVAEKIKSEDCFNTTTLFKALHPPYIHLYKHTHKNTHTGSTPAYENVHTHFLFLSRTRICILTHTHTHRHVRKHWDYVEAKGAISLDVETGVLERGFQLQQGSWRGVEE